MNSIEKLISQKIKEATEGDLGSVTPSLALQVFSGGRKRVSLKLGKEFKYFDLASLTKILFTTSAFMNLHDKDRSLLSQPIVHRLPDWPHKSVSSKGLLQHNVGLPWWNAYYKKLKKPQAQGMSRELLREKLWNLLCKEPQDRRRKKAIYSDLDFLVLGFYLEQVTGSNLAAHFDELKDSWMTSSLHFCLDNKPKYARRMYAPTEKCPWRKKVLQGEVHDDNTWSMSGVSTHAGLFGTIDDVSRWGLELRKGYLGQKSRLASTSTIRYFCRRSLPRTVGDWGLGFMKPSRPSSSCGKHFALSSVGHTGFTGTSLWWDPRADLLVVLLTNRVHPSRDNRKFVELRPKIHDWVWQAVSHS